MKLNKRNRIKLVFITLLQSIFVFVGYHLMVKDNLILGLIPFTISIVSLLWEEIYLNNLYFFK